MRNKKRADFKSTLFTYGWKMGLEPTTHGTTIRYSNQLSYIHRVFASANIQLFLLEYQVR